MNAYNHRHIHSPIAMVVSVVAASLLLSQAMAQSTSGPACVCGVGTNCCANNEVCHDNNCIGTCPNPTVQDVRSQQDDQCLDIQNCGGRTIDHCVQCDASNSTCFRCENGYSLEFNRESCVESCANGESRYSLVLLSPVIRIVCDAPDGQVAVTDPPTFPRTNAPTISFPTMSPSTRSPTVLGDTFSPTVSPVSSAPTAVVTPRPTAATTTQPQANQTPSPVESDDSFDLKWIIIGAVGGVTLLLIVAVLIYVCRDKLSCAGCCYCCCFGRSRDEGQKGENVEMGQISSRVAKPAVISLGDSGGGGGSGTDESTIINPTMEEGGLQTEDYLTGPEATEFFNWLNGLKKHKATFVILLKEMTTRRDKQTTAFEREKYEKVVNDLTRLLQLFKQKKENRRAPSDGMQLLDWAQKTVDRFNEGG